METTKYTAKELHRALDILMAQFIMHTNGLILSRPIQELMEFAHTRLVEEMANNGK